MLYYLESWAVNKGARMQARWLWARMLLLPVVLLVGCSTFGAPSSPPGPGVPRIANLRFDPDSIEAGGTTTLSFYFEDGSAELSEGYLLDQGIAEFQFFTALQPITIDLRQYAGQVAGFAEVPIRWPKEGVRWVELHVVNKKGNVSNRLRARLTVR